MSNYQSNTEPSEKVSIYIVAHKQVSTPPLSPIYKTIQVGAAPQFSTIRDSTGDNIASKNPTFCELTALYWIWKNDSHSEIVGVAHYRRFLTKNWLSNSPKYFLSSDDIESSLAVNDIILPAEDTVSAKSLRDHFVLTSGHEKDLDNCREIISDIAPDYLDPFDKVLSSRTAHYCNMLICSKALFDEYCQWLFAILFRLEAITDLSGYTDYQKRIYGFLGEILLNVWVDKQQYKVATYEAVRTDCQPAVRVLKEAVHRAHNLLY